MNKLEQRADKDAPIELDQIFRHFTMDSEAVKRSNLLLLLLLLLFGKSKVSFSGIASTVFSIDVDSTANPENEFLKNGVNFLQVFVAFVKAIHIGISIRAFQGWRFFLSAMMPTLVYWLNIGAFNPTASEYFSRVTRRLIKGDS
jgi:hypothetical protein